MSKKGLLSIILVLLTAFAFPFQVFALTDGYTRIKPDLDVAPVGYDAAILDEYIEDLEAFKAYIIKEALEFNDQIYIGDYNLPMKEEVYTNLAYYLAEEVPELFHVGSVGYSVKKETLINMNINYNYTKEQYEEMFAQCEAVAEEMLWDIIEAEHLSEAEKALLVHDRLALRCNYDKSLTHDNKFDMYGALVDGYAVCEGYTKAYMYLLDKLGIKSKICSSETLIHSWNIVWIDGVPYHVDVTWDDVIGLAGEVYHDNFLVSSEALYRGGGSELFDNGHVADDYDTTPSDTRYDEYFWRHSYSAFQLLDGELYYIGSTRCTINKYTNETNEELYRCRTRWNKYWNLYGRLSTDGDMLFYNTNTGIFTFDPETLLSTLIFQPEEVSQGLEIYGFEYRDRHLICDLSATNNYFNAEVLRIDKLYEKGQQELITPGNNIPQYIKLISSFSTIYCPIGSEIKTEELQLEVTYSNGATKTVSEGFTVSGLDSSTPGTKTVYITWEGIVTHFEVHVFAYGDANGDGKVSVADATAIQKFVASIIEFSDVQKAAGEVTGDNRLTVADATKIQKYIAGLVQNIV